MHARSLKPLTYNKAVTILNGRDTRKIANNTYLQRKTDSSIAVHLHNTDVVTYYASGYTVVRTGGWETVTTKDRITSTLPGSRLGSIKGEWTIRDSCGREYYYRESDVTLPDGTEDYGVCISPSGDVLNCQLVLASLITDVAGVECTNESCATVIAGLALKELKKLWRRARDYRSVLIEHCQFELLPLFSGECNGVGAWEQIFKHRLAHGE